jgi:hypothetical protein
VISFFFIVSPCSATFVAVKRYGPIADSRCRECQIVTRECTTVQGAETCVVFAQESAPLEERRADEPFDVMAITGAISLLCAASIERAERHAHVPV